MGWSVRRMARGAAFGSVLSAAVGFGLSAVSGEAQAPPPGAHRPDEVREDATTQVLREAEAALEKGDTRTAETKLQQLAEKKPNDPQVLYDLGYAQESNDENDAAAKSYAAAVAADGGLAQPRLALGLLEARSGKSDEARLQLTAVAGMKTAAPDLRGRALRALARLDATANPAQASDELLAAVRLTGEMSGDSALTAELAERSGDAADSEAAYRRALAANPGNVDATVGLAHVLVREGRNADAEAVLQPVLDKHSDDPRLVAQMASALAADGKTDLAIPLVEGLRERSPEFAADPAMTRLLAQIYSLAGEGPKAEPLYRQMVAANPGDPSLKDALGGLLVKDQKYAEAEKVLAQAVSERAAFHNDQDWGEAAGHLAFAASRNGDPKTTLQALSARATVLPESPATLFLEATAYDTLHQYQQAAKTYRAFLAVADGKFPDEEFEARHRLVALKSMR
ncbi:Tetratricopeptide repeat-containing protein [Bryocella elongata]|uniref:Tetratricopeptide repeat-containing protein n=1 Tax=Bryocella elongata TaxID=863522 RepID=A0A1H5TT61_9BACT|nr:tetratricopeptide repeat protein [Bryocella elongata]SEF66015.1 Tetratricopeptide repeat-containing protein [Bryocella elongata]